jgi:hypothetical protein
MRDDEAVSQRAPCPTATWVDATWTRSEWDDPQMPQHIAKYCCFARMKEETTF